MNVLIVEDDTLLKELLKKQLEMHGHDVWAYETAEQALTSYSQIFYPLAIVDLGLPDMDGLDLCRQIRKISWGKQSMILIITGRDTLEDVEAALNAGADDYLMKPITRTALDVRLTVIEQQIHVFTGYRRDLPQLQLFRNLLEYANDMLLIINPITAKVIEVNDRASQRLGYTRQELIAKRLGDLVTGLSSPARWEEYLEAIGETRSLFVNEEYCCKDGTLLQVESSIAYVTQPDQEYIVAIGRDLANRVRK